MPELENHGADTLAVGSPELYPLYLYIVRSALESVDVYPKVECTDVVRWSCYEDGSIILL